MEKTAAVIAKDAGHHNIHRLILDRGQGSPLENEDAIRAATVSSQPKQVPVRRDGGVKPLVALNGSKIRTRSSRTSALNYFKLSDYSERELPVGLKEVDGLYASITRVDPSGIISVIKVAKGELIPGTSFRLQEIEPRKVRSNGLPENMIDTARVRIQHIKTQANYLLVKNAKIKPVDSYAILTANNSDYRYVAKTGDIFQVVDPDNGERDFQVVAVGQSDVAVKELASAKIVRLGRSAKM